MACDCKIAIGGVMRGGARAGCLTSRLVATIGGVRVDPATAPSRILIDSLSVHDALNEVPNTAIFTVRGAKPTEGAEVILAFQSINNGTRLFAGHLIRITQVYVGQQPTRPQNYLWRCEATDYTWRLNAQVLVARYRGVSATTIIRDLVATWAPAGYTTIGVQENLPILDEISLTNLSLMDAIRHVAERIGGYAECDYFKDVKLWIEIPPSVVSPLRALTPDHPSVQDVQYTRDLTQIVTRALVEGGGVNALTDVAPGATILPVEDDAWYSPSGGLVVSGPQRIRYTGVIPGGPGTLVGPGVVPTTGPTLALQQGAGVDPGYHAYVYTFVTATGETLPSPGVAITTGTVDGPPAAPTGWQAASNVGAKTIGRVYEYAVAYSVNPAGSFPYDLTALTAVSPGLAMTAVATTAAGNPGKSGEPFMVVTYTADTRIQTLWPLMRPQGQTAWAMLGAGIPNVPASAGGTVAQNDYLSDAQYATQQKYPGANPLIAKVVISGISPGPAGTVSRKIYRSAANTDQPRKLLITIADNTTTTYTDTLADATLGAVVPASDTSGLQTAAGTVPAGSTSIRVASTQPFTATGGWILVGTQPVVYTGKTATDLTGIPPTGSGSLTASVPYNTVIVRAAQLTGIPASGTGAIVLPILQGDPVNVLIVVDDAAAQAALATLVGGDGIQVAYLQDRRISITEATARGKALLAQKKDVIETVRYACRDPTTQAGASVTVNLPAPTAVAGIYRIQDVQIGRFHPHAYPLYQVTASSSRFTFEDLLRRQRGA